MFLEAFNQGLIMHEIGGFVYKEPEKFSVYLKIMKQVL
jgi:hypothetical protein